MTKCNYCLKDFNSKSALNIHQKSALYCLKLQGKTLEEIKTFKCELCQTEFTLKSTLQKHIERCKNNNNKKQTELDVYIEENKKLKEELEQNKEDNKKYREEILIKNEKIENLLLNHRENLNKIEKLENAIIGIAESKNEISNDINDENQIEILTNKYGKRTKRKQIKEPDVVYILTTESLKKERRYIFGKSKNLTNRLSTYNKTDEHEVVYYQPCGNELNMDTVEKIVLNRLDRYREVKNRDRFILPEDKDIDFFINIIKKGIEFMMMNNEN